MSAMLPASIEGLDDVVSVLGVDLQQPQQDDAERAPLKVCTVLHLFPQVVIDVPHANFCHDRSTQRLTKSTPDGRMLITRSPFDHHLITARCAA
jgi:hypothetical protein